MVRVVIDMIVSRQISPQDNRRQRGFTLLEILFVLLILSILMMIALPLYKNYTIRVKIGTGITMVGPAKNGITEYHLTYKEFPVNNGQAGIAEPNQFNLNYLSRLEVFGSPASGAITLTFDNAQIPELGSGNTIVYNVTKVGGLFEWDCRFGSMKNKYRPSNCRIE